MNKLKRYLKMISPFNNMDEMPTAAYIAKKMLAFLLLYYAAAALGGLLNIGGVIMMGYDPMQGIMPDDRILMLMQYYGFAVFMILAILYCKFIEKRPIKTMGLNRSIYDYISGALIAAVLLVVIMGVCCMAGSLSYTGIGKDIDHVYMLALLAAFVIQGAAEEILCRGFLMSSLLKKASIPMSIFFSSTAFAFPHFFTMLTFEAEYAVIGIVNLYLISIIFSLLILCRSNIWVACGLHSIWNFLLYGVFGLALSGSETGATGMICFEIEQFNIINGGLYGVEASILTTVVLTIVVVVLCKYLNTGKVRGDRNGI